MDAHQILELLSKAGPIAMLFGIVLWAGHRQYWVWGHQLQAMTVDRDFYRKMMFDKITQLDTVASERLRTEAERGRAEAERGRVDAERVRRGEP